MAKKFTTSISKKKITEDLRKQFSGMVTPGTIEKFFNPGQVEALATHPEIINRLIEGKQGAAIDFAKDLVGQHMFPNISREVIAQYIAPSIGATFNQIGQGKFNTETAVAPAIPEGFGKQLMAEFKFQESDIPALTEGFNIGADSKFAEKVSPDDPNAPAIAAAIHIGLRDKIGAITGRGATQQEIITAFNSLDSSAIDIDDLIDSPATSIRGIANKGSTSPVFNIVSQTMLEAQRVGQTLSPQDISFITSAATKEDADIEAGKVLKRLKEDAVTASSGGIAGQELEAIGELEKQATERGTQFFQEQFAPQVEQLLQRRGIRTSGSLAEALAQGGISLRRNLQEQFEPLRAQSKLGGIQKSYENTLRSALESGQSLQQAISTANQMTFQRRQQDFSRSESALDRQMQQLLSQQNLATALALQQRTQRPSSFDQFLQYGLQPSVQVASPFIQQKAKTGSFIGG